MHIRFFYRASDEERIELWLDSGEILADPDREFTVDATMLSRKVRERLLKQESDLYKHTFDDIKMFAETTWTYYTGPDPETMNDTQKIAFIKSWLDLRENM